MGLKPVGVSQAVSLGIGTTEDCFKQAGKWPLHMDIFKSFVSEGATLVAVDLSM